VRGGQLEMDCQVYTVIVVELLQECKILLGTAKSSIRLLGRANEYVNRMGISSPGLNSFTHNMEYYGNPSIDFANDELSNVR